MTLNHDIWNTRVSVEADKLLKELEERNEELAKTIRDLWKTDECGKFLHTLITNYRNKKNGFSLHVASLVMGLEGLHRAETGTGWSGHTSYKPIR